MPSAMDRGRQDDMTVGASVKLVGFKAHPELNGAIGTLMNVDTVNAHCLVRLQTGHVKRLSMKNCQVVGRKIGKSDAEAADAALEEMDRGDEEDQVGLVSGEKKPAKSPAAKSADQDGPAEGMSRNVKMGIAGAVLFGAVCVAMMSKGGGKVCATASHLEKGFSVSHKSAALCYSADLTDSGNVLFTGQPCGDGATGGKLVQWTKIQNPAGDEHCMWSRSDLPEDKKEDMMGSCGVAPKKWPKLPVEICAEDVGKVAEEAAPAGAEASPEAVSQPEGQAEAPAEAQAQEQAQAEGQPSAAEGAPAAEAVPVVEEARPTLTPEETAAATAEGPNTVDLRGADVPAPGAEDNFEGMHLTSANMAASPEGYSADDTVVVYIADGPLAGSRLFGASIETLSRFGLWTGPVVVLTDEPICVKKIQKPRATAMGLTLTVIETDIRRDLIDVKMQKAEVWSYLVRAGFEDKKQAIYIDEDVIIGAPLKPFLDKLNLPENRAVPVVMFQDTHQRPHGGVVVSRKGSESMICMNEWAVELSRNQREHPSMWQSDQGALERTKCWEGGQVKLLQTGWGQGLFGWPSTTELTQHKRCVFVHFTNPKYMKQPGLKGIIRRYFERDLGLIGDPYLTQKCAATPHKQKRQGLIGMGASHKKEPGESPAEVDTTGMDPKEKAKVKAAREKAKEKEAEAKEKEREKAKEEKEKEKEKEEERKEKEKEQKKKEAAKKKKAGGD